MKIAILASGTGSNVKFLFESAKTGKIPNAEWTVLITDKQEALAFKVAEEYGVKSVYIDPEHKGARFSASAAERYMKLLKESGTELVVLAGFMRILPPEFVEEYDGRMINLHPSLLPAFKGKDAIKQAFDYGVKVCGCSVHYVSNELDGGKIIAQEVVEVKDSDTLETLEMRVHDAEHKLLSEVVARFTKGEL